MPANYAHYRFGKQLLSGMCPNDRRSIQRFRRLYDMGLHGPDIFFYYNPLIKTATGQLGGVFHAQSGQEFFARVCAQAGIDCSFIWRSKDRVVAAGERPAARHHRAVGFIANCFELPDATNPLEIAHMCAIR